MLDLLDLFPKSLTSEAQSNQAYNQNEVKKHIQYEIIMGVWNVVFLTNYICNDRVLL